MSDENKSDIHSQLYRRTVLASTAAAATAGMIGSAAGNSENGYLTREPATRSRTTSQSTTNLDDPPTVLLIRDCVIWDTTGNEDVLQELGYEYDIISSQDAVDQLPEYDQLTEIEVILIPSTQPTAFYENLNSIWETITGFVQDGGILVVHAGESGWPCQHPAEQEGSKLSFPRGVNNEYTFIPADGGFEEIEALQELTVSADDHPIAEGMDNESLSYWAGDISTFGYYSGVPEEANEIFGLQIDPQAHPTYIEYPFGQGVVLTTMQAPEWPFGHDDFRGGTQELLLNELEYAVETAKEIADPPDEGRIQGTVTIADTETATVDATAYLIDPIRGSAVEDYIEGTGALPETEEMVSVEDGEFVFDEIDAGEQLVLVDPVQTFDPEYEVVAVPTEQTTNVSFELDAERYLSRLDSEITGIENAADEVIRESTKDISHIHYDGINAFDDDIDKKDILNNALSVTQFAMGMPDPEDKAKAAAKIADLTLSTHDFNVEEYGYNQYLAGRVIDTEPEIRGDLEEYIDRIFDTGWIADPDHSRNQNTRETIEVFLSETEICDTATNSLKEKIQRYETEVVWQEPHDEFSIPEAKQVLRAQQRWLADNGLAPGVVVTPTHVDENIKSSGYVTRKAHYHRNHFEGVYDELKTTDRLKTASKISSTAGLGIKKGGIGSGIGLPVAAIGAVAYIGGKVGSYAFNTHSMVLENQLADAHADALIYWIDDLEKATTAVDDILDWLEAETTNPTLQDVDGEIDSADLGGVSPPLSDTTYALANKPDYPTWWVLSPLPAPQTNRVATNTVEIRNTGSAPSEFKLTTIDTYGDGNKSGVSDAVSVRPDHNGSDDDLDPVLEPGDSIEIDIEYSSDFHWNSPFNWHTMTTVLWMNGKPVDDSEDPYYIVPSMDVIPFSAQEGDSLDVEAALEGAETDVEIETQSYRLTDASKGPKEALTVDDWTENIGDIVEIIDETVSTEQTTAGTQFEVGSELQGIVFILAAPPDAELNMHVYDEAGRHVGYEPEDDTDVVEIPGAEYNGSDSTKEIVLLDDAAGSYDIEVEAARFIADDAVSVSAYAVEIPQRDAVVGISPTVAGTVLEPGETETVEVELSETGEQAGVDITNISLEPFQTESGAPLEDAAVLLSETPDEITAGGTERVELTFDAAPSLSVPDGESDRVWSELTIETANAGTIVAEITVLVFETDEDARLVESGIGVESVSIDTVSADEVPEPPEENLAVTDGYEVDVAGEDVAAVSFPSEFVEDKLTTAYQVNDNEWTNLDTSAGERVAVEVGAPADEMLVITQEDIGPSIADYADSGTGTVETDGLRDAIDDWRAGGIDTGLLRDVIDAWRSGDPVE